MKLAAVSVMIVASASSTRLPAETRCLPHMVQSASIVESSPRGTRIISTEPAALSNSKHYCVPSNNSCACAADRAFIYFPRTNEVIYFKQTLGPMAYTAAIICALASLYFLCENEKKATIASSATLALALCFVKVPLFPTQSDEVHFWASLAMTAFAACYNESAADVCMFALISLADAIYRTPETPYAHIICLLLAIRLWDRVFIFIHAVSGVTVWQKMDFLSAMIYTVFTSETATVPQFEHYEDWPIYGGTAVYVTFAVAFMRHSTDRI
jgi:hypothetical protein